MNVWYIILILLLVNIGPIWLMVTAYREDYESVGFDSIGLLKLIVAIVALFVIEIFIVSFIKVAIISNLT